jgi:hypothetical protein
MKMTILHEILIPQLYLVTAMQKLFIEVSKNCVVETSSAFVSDKTRIRKSHHVFKIRLVKLFL